MAQCKKNNSSLLSERTSAFTSKASITVEASFVISIFFLAVMCVVCLFEVSALQLNIKSALHSAGKEIAEEAYMKPFFFPDRLENRIVELIGKQRLDTSLVRGGSYGLDCSGTKTYFGSTIMDLCVYYQIEIPVLIFRIPVIAREEIIRIKGWSGEDVNFADSEKQQMVYVTEHGQVYHQELTCTYLDLAIHSVFYEQITNLRNENGAKYYACERCAEKKDTMKVVYITNQGIRYHESLACSGLKRKIYMVPLSEVNGIGGCSKCTK